jgi:hypothetical protein
MGEKIPHATHEGIVELGDGKYPCAVLPDETRVLTARGFLDAIGRKYKSRSHEVRSRSNYPVFIAASNLKSYVSKDLEDGLTPIKFRNLTGQIAHGYRAELLGEVCGIYVKAKHDGVILPSQQHIADRCELMSRALVGVAIIALIDEATGFQTLRDKRALQAILQRFLLDEYARWAKRFPDEFYKEMFRLKGWQWKGMRVNRPSVVGRYTNDLVWDRLAPGVLEELQRRNPKDEKGRRKAKHHQFLTDDIGHPALAQHLYATLGFMRASSNWGQFYRMMQRAYPKLRETLPLPFDEDGAA